MDTGAFVVSCSVLSLSAGSRERSAGAAVCFLSDCFGLISCPFVQGYKLLMTSPLETAFFQTICLVKLLAFLQYLKDLLDVSVALIHFHLDFVPRSLLV